MAALLALWLLGVAPAGAADRPPALPGLLDLFRPSGMPFDSGGDLTVVHPEARPDERFLLEKIVVVGNTVLKDDELQRLLQPFQGREVTLESLEAASESIQKLYRKKGFFLARAFVPQQEIVDGEARIQVIEGKVGKVVIMGNRRYNEKLLRRFFSPALKKGVLHAESLQKTLLLMNEMPDVTVKAVLQKGAEDGTTDVVLKVEEKKFFHLGFDYNNFGNPWTGENRFGLDVVIDNLQGIADSLFLRGVTITPSSSTTPFLQAAYTVPVNREGTKASLSYANSDVRVGRELAVLDIRGKAEIYGLTVSHPLKRTSDSGANLTYGYASKSIRNYYYGGIPTSSDEIRAVNVGYNMNWISGLGKNFLYLTVTQGLGEILGGMRHDTPNPSRAHGGNSFTRFNMDLYRIQKMGPRAFLILRGSGQLAAQPLVVAEQFALGGPDSVRGYMQSEFLGDSGYSVSAEARIPLSRKSNSVQAAAFIDYGYVALKEAQPGETGSRSLTGAGLGLRLNLGSDSWARLDWGWPLDPGTTQLNRKPVFYGQFSTRF